MQDIMCITFHNNTIQFWFGSGNQFVQINLKTRYYAFHAIK